ncbi:uncharacterized protein Dwil_GK12567 [Drosophila willistoni]|uniref:RRM domain-containing protein n=1 Tax=Drosophila willistoni TaxID=7260 RepID=B4N2V3_DROWI|nr:uncharacterized protein Dwil_GK12567 [Drosophila willistoni]
MSVIIRLQNLPWTANARDIRNFFTGLSIPEGGVHIIGGEMGDAFIAFSTDEDARCAMLKDREKLMEVQVRLLLSSRAEMQKVIETARLRAAAPPSAAASATATAALSPALAPVVVATSKPRPIVVPSPQVTPNPPNIGGGLGSFLSSVTSATQGPSFLDYQQQAGVTLIDVSNSSGSSRRQHSRSRSRSRSHSTSSDDSDRSRERDRGRKRRSERPDSNERELKVQPVGGLGNLLPWATSAVASVAGGVTLPGLGNHQLHMPPVLPSLQSYRTSSTPNHMMNAVPAPVAVSSPSPQNQEPITFASVNPYAQMYPQLFQQQHLILQQQQQQQQQQQGSNKALSSGSGSSPSQSVVVVPIADTCYIKISGMCPSTSYSDLRKYFSGLYIPHNGIKIMTVHGNRTGVAYVEFSRVSSAQKALSRNNTMFRDRLVQIVPIGDEEFEQAEEKLRQAGNNGGGRGGGGNASGGGDRGSDRSNSSSCQTTVLYVEDLPQLTTEQDIMKMFSATCTIVDILLAPSPQNRREFVAFVLFARENEARSALEDTSSHYIGFRQLRVRSSSQAEMQHAKEKQRRANEQLMKEEEELQRREEQEEMLLKERERELEREKEQQDQLAAAMNVRYQSDPRRRQNGNENQQLQHQQQQQPFQMQMQQQQQQQQQPNVQLPPFVNMNGMPPMLNGGTFNGNPPFQMMDNNQRNHIGGGPSGSGCVGGPGPQQFPNPTNQENNFVRVHNCEYGTRINDLGELFSSENLRIEHIEQLYKDRQRSGEFIIEFSDEVNAKRAIREFHNRRFRGRGIRVVPISPQEIADRMNKPFMTYVPGGNGPRTTDNSNNGGNISGGGVGGGVGGGGSGVIGGIGLGSGDGSGSGSGGQQQLHDNNEETPKQQHQRFNPFARNDIDQSPSISSPPNPSLQSPSDNQQMQDQDNGGIPDKFNHPGCVVAMRNVPFKADLKDILRFFNDYKLSPHDIIRRFNDDGKPTGDARVAFENPSEARSAFESRRRKQIFNRTVYLDII